MNILEKEIEDVVWNSIRHNQYDLLKDRGLFLSSRLCYLRQPDLGIYGRPDLVGFNIGKKFYGQRTLYVHLIELKKGLIDTSTLLQASRYCSGIRYFAEKKSGLNGIWVDFRILLIGKEIQINGDFVFLADNHPSLELYTYSIDLEKGIVFNREQGFFISDEKEIDTSSYYKNMFLHQVKDYYNKNLILESGEF